MGRTSVRRRWLRATVASVVLAGSTVATMAAQPATATPPAAPSPTSMVESHTFSRGLYLGNPGIAGSIVIPAVSAGTIVAEGGSGENGRNSVNGTAGGAGFPGSVSIV